MKKLKYYIKERHNPQFSRPYYTGMGQLDKSQVKRAENPAYGFNVLHAYDTAEEYEAALASFMAQVKSA